MVGAEISTLPRSHAEIRSFALLSLFQSPSRTDTQSSPSRVAGFALEEPSTPHNPRNLADLACLYAKDVDDAILHLAKLVGRTR
jgi:hypothetical protein